MVGGGIFALAGVAFAVTGPSAILAFLLNGLIAFITALTFAEMASANPQSGGMYTYAKKALTVEVAFAVGWVIWFASIVAALLYSVGFAAFFVIMLQQFELSFLGYFLDSRWAIVVFAVLATITYTVRNSIKKTAGGSWINIGKILVFVIIIATGLAILISKPEVSIPNSLQPFFTGGMSGLLIAMGYTFIAVQGFGLISNVSGEIIEPEKNIPKAMMATVIIGMIIYLPLLFVVMTVGVPAGESITAMGTAYPDAVVAIAVQNFLGPFGFWLVIIGGIFSMLSALQANLYSASRIALAMAQDRTLGAGISEIHSNYGTPVPAILTTASVVVLLILLLPNVAAAGAASGLIFLITYSIAHFLVIILRKRGSDVQKGFRIPFFPALPLVGMAACIALVLFQAVSVPVAGLIAGGWLVVGLILFLVLYEKQAQVVDAYSEASDPTLAKLRGHNPLVLVPIANPEHASSMVFLADALTPPKVGRIMLFSTISPATTESSIHHVKSNQEGLQQALATCLEEGFTPEALATIADNPWDEISRIAQYHGAKSILLGLSKLEHLGTANALEHLANSVSGDLVVFKQPHKNWHVTEAKKVLIPVAGEGLHDTLRARIIGSLSRVASPGITFLHILPENTSKEFYEKRVKQLHLFASRLVTNTPNIKVIKSNTAADVLIKESNNADLVILGLGRNQQNQRTFGDYIIRLAKETNTALILISRATK